MPASRRRCSAGVLLAGLVLALCATTLLGSTAPAFAAPAESVTPAVALSSATTDAPSSADPAVTPAAPPSRSLSQLRVDTARMHTPWYMRLWCGVGLLLLLALAWSMSTDRRRIPWRVVLWGSGLQIVFALIVLKTGPGQAFFSAINDGFIRLLDFTETGASFVFGNLVHGNIPVGELRYPAEPFVSPLANEGPQWAKVGAFIAFSVLPTIVFFSSLMAVLYHLGVMQRIVRAMAWVMQRTMGTSGAESLSASANIFVGMTEAPLMVRPYVSRMTRSELMAVMTGGFATVAGGVMLAYIKMLQASFPDIAGHLLSASVMSAPASLVVAKLLVPEQDRPATAGGVTSAGIDPSAGAAAGPEGDVHIPVNVIDAAATGAADGMKLALNVGAMLVAFVALIALINAVIGAGGAWLGVEGLTFQGVVGWLFWPLALIMGVPPSECYQVGQLLGEKTVINEFVAYAHLASGLGSDLANLSPRSVLITTYALCGFANFGSIAIQLGGIGGMAPGRRGDVARLGLRAMIGGTLAAFLTAAVAGMVV